MASARLAARRHRAWLGGVVLGVWCILMLIVGAGLLAQHLLAMPPPPATHTVGVALARLREPTAPRSWLAVHALYAECRCSQAIVEHLITAPRLPDWSEVVLWVGKAPPPPELSHRIRVVTMDRVGLAVLGIEAAPLLVVLDPYNEVRYAGGYTGRKQGPDIRDLAIMAEIRRAPLRTRVAAALPVYGCAVSERLRAELALLPSP